MSQKGRCLPVRLGAIATDAYPDRPVARQARHTVRYDDLIVERRSLKVSPKPRGRRGRPQSLDRAPANRPGAALTDDSATGAGGSVDG